jgi:hypothetical protein
MAQVKKKSFIQKNGLIAVWGMAGLIASGYIAFLFMGAGPKTGHNPKLADNGSAPASPTANPMHEEVASLRAHVVKLKDQEEQLAQKISKIEQTLGPITASISDQKTNTGYGIDEETPAAPDAAATGAAPNVSVKMLPLTQDDTVAEVYSLGGFDTYGLSLAKARSLEALERHWDYATRTAGAALADLKPRYLKTGAGDNVQYELIAGPLDRMSDATARCERLSKLNIDCSNTRYDLSLDSASLVADDDATK